MPSLRSTSTKTARRVPRLKLVPARKSKPFAAPARKAKPVRRAAVAVKPAGKVKPALTRKPAAKPAKSRPAPLALVPPRARPGSPAVPAKGAVPVSPSAPVERVPREQLLARYTPLIKYVVERLAVGLPKNVDHEDLMSAGMLGLLDAYD
ncbi:MAG: hypothetical protein ABI960_07150, partial [Candidatus Eisenbacteria bacterium]